MGHHLIGTSSYQREGLLSIAADVSIRLLFKLQYLQRATLPKASFTEENEFIYQNIWNKRTVLLLILGCPSQVSPVVNLQVDCGKPSFPVCGNALNSSPLASGGCFKGQSGCNAPSQSVLESAYKLI